MDIDPTVRRMDDGTGPAVGSRPAAIPRLRLGRVLAGLILFGVSFGYVEAAVVVYLRAIYEPMRQAVHPDRAAGDLFPLLRIEDLQAAGEVHVRRLATEVGREASTLVILASVALLVARGFRQWFASFVIAFGVWDICYYVFLKLLLGWPASLLTWDILFLIPVPWVGPVIAPVLVALCMVLAGAIFLWRESIGRPVRLGLWRWLAVIVGGAIIVVAFCWDYRNIAAGGYPNSFNWPLFTGGLLLGVAAFAHGLVASRGERVTARGSLSARQPL